MFFIQWFSGYTVIRPVSPIDDLSLFNDCLQRPNCDEYLTMEYMKMRSSPQSNVNITTQHSDDSQSIPASQKGRNSLFNTYQQFINSQNGYHNRSD